MALLSSSFTLFSVLNHILSPFLPPHSGRHTPETAYWIGASDAQHENSFTWTSGAPFFYTGKLLNTFMQVSLCLCTGEAIFMTAILFQLTSLSCIELFLLCLLQIFVVAQLTLRLE